MRLGVETRLMDQAADGNVIQTGFVPVFIPIEEHSVFIMLIDSKVARRGLARAGLKTSDRRFVDFDAIVYGGGEVASWMSVIQD